MKIAIIGAGVSGLASIKCCLDEGLEPVCFEKSSSIGGLWKFSHDQEMDTNVKSGSVYESTVINTSKEMTCFSDFPAPKYFPPFMPRDHVVEYLQMYAENFKLSKHIRFNVTVLDISRTPNHRNTGQWRVSHKDINGNVTESIFDAVMICNGHLSKPYFPAFKGIDAFQGQKLHSHAYKSYRGYENKVVVVIGKFQTIEKSFYFYEINLVSSIELNVRSLLALHRGLQKGSSHSRWLRFRASRLFCFVTDFNPFWVTRIT